MSFCSGFRAIPMRDRQSWLDQRARPSLCGDMRMLILTGYDDDAAAGMDRFLSRCFRCSTSFFRHSFRCWQCWREAHMNTRSRPFMKLIEGFLAVSSGVR